MNFILSAIAVVFISAKSLFAMQNPSTDKSQLWQQLGVNYVEENFYPDWYSPVPNQGGRNILAWGAHFGPKLLGYLKSANSEEFVKPFNPDDFAGVEVLPIFLKNKVQYVVHDLHKNINPNKNVDVKAHKQFKGYGAFANKKFVENEVIGEYVGCLKYFDPETTLSFLAEQVHGKFKTGEAYKIQTAQVPGNDDLYIGENQAYAMRTFLACTPIFLRKIIVRPACPSRR